MRKQAVLAFDPGASITKTVVQIGDRAPELQVFGSEVIRLPTSSIHSRHERDAQSSVLTAQNDAWVKPAKTSEYAYAVGALARQFRAEASMQTLKLETSVPKFQAVLGAIAEQTASLSDEPLEVKAVLLLPYGEYANRMTLLQQLKRHARSFYFRNRKVRVELDNLLVVPEGGGFVWDLQASRGESWLTHPETVITIVMIGHRNASVLTFEGGRLNNQATATSDLGFVRLVDGVIERTAGQDRECLSDTICRVGRNPDPDHPLIRAATRSRDPANVEQEAKQLVEAIQTSAKEYWVALERWLDDVLPQSVTEAIVSGGGARYFQPEIDQYLSWAEPGWRELPPAVESALLSEHVDDSLSCRTADVWALFASAFPSAAERLQTRADRTS